MNEKNLILSTLKSTSLFTYCTDEALENFSAQSNLVSAEKGEILFVHEEPAHRFYIILQGWVKLFRETLDGTQAITDILSVGKIFGDTSLFEESNYPYSAEVVEQSKLISIPLSLLKSEMDANPKIAVSMLATMAQYRRQQDKELEHRTIQNAPQRIGCFLLRLIDQSKEGEVNINLPYDKTLVAARLGMQPETFSRALATLKERTGIKVKGSSVHLDNIQQLIDFSCIACSSNFPCKDLCQKTSVCSNK